MDVATVGYSVDTSGLKQGEAALDSFGSKNKKAAEAVTELATASNQTGSDLGDNAAAANSATTAHDNLSKSAMLGYRQFRLLNESVRLAADGLIYGAAPGQLLGIVLERAAIEAAMGVNIFSRLGQTLSALLTPTRLLVGGLALAAGGFYFLFESIKTAELQFGNLSDRINTTIQQLHGLQTNASLGAGIGQDDFLKQMEKFGDDVTKAQVGLGTLPELLRANSAQAKTFVDYLAFAADYISGAKNEAQKYRMIQQLGLPATQQWVQYLSQGSAAIRQAATEATGFGGKAELDMIRKARDFDTAWNRAWTNFKNTAKSSILNMVDEFPAPDTPLAAFFKMIKEGKTPHVTFDLSPEPGSIVDVLWQKIRPTAAAVLGEPPPGPPSALTGVPVIPVTSSALPGAATQKPTIDPEVQKQAIALQLAHITALNNLATAQDKVKQKELELQRANLDGAKITGQQIAAITAYTEKEALGIIAIQQQRDAQQTEAANIGKSVGAAAAYRSVQDQVNEAIRKGAPLKESQIEQIRREAAELGALTDVTARAKLQHDINFEREQVGRTQELAQAYSQVRSALGETTSATAQFYIAQIAVTNYIKTAQTATESFLNTYSQGVMDGKTKTEALHDALKNLASTLVQMANKQLVASAFGLLFGSTGGAGGAGVAAGAGGAVAGGGLLAMLFGGGKQAGIGADGIGDGSFNAIDAAAPPLGGGGMFMDGSTIIGGGISGLYHSGGIVGSGGGPRRYVHPSYFDHAPRMHGGGIAGDEVGIIARRGEGVFTPEQMKAMGGQSNGPPIIFNNDFRGAAPEAVASISTQLDRLQKQVMNMPQTLKQIKKWRPATQ